jgi:hypothetical protein
MVAALADHAGGEASLRGMVISLGGEVAAPGECDAVKPERGRDRAAGGDSRPASLRCPKRASRTVRSRRS